MAWAFVQGRGNENSLTIAFTSDVAAGSLLYLAFGRGGNAADSVADPVNGAWTSIRDTYDATNDQSHATWYFKNSAALTGATNRTVTVTTSGSYYRASIAEYTGQDQTTQLDNASAETGAVVAATTTPATATLAARTYDGGLWIASIQDIQGAGSAISAGTSITYTKRDACDAGADVLSIEDGVDPNKATTTYKGDWNTANVRTICHVAVFKAAAGGGPTYTLACDSGSFSLTGQAVTLKAARTLALASGSFSETGQAVSLLVSRKLTCDVGSYAETGQAIGLTVARKLSLDAGAFSETGQAVGLLVARKLTAEAGSFAITGQSVGLLAARKLALDAGSFTLTGQSASLFVSRLLSLAYGLFALTGQDVTLTYTPIAVSPWRQCAAVPYAFGNRP